MKVIDISEGDILRNSTDVLTNSADILRNSNPPSDFKIVTEAYRAMLYQKYPTIAEVGLSLCLKLNAFICFGGDFFGRGWGDLTPSRTIAHWPSYGSVIDATSVAFRAWSTCAEDQQGLGCALAALACAKYSCNF